MGCGICAGSSRVSRQTREGFPAGRALPAGRAQHTACRHAYTHMHIQLEQKPRISWRESKAQTRKSLE